MPLLTPTEASRIAAGVYELRDQSVSAATRTTDLGSEGLFAVDDQSRLTGRSGALLYRPLSGFGYAAIGVDRFDGEALLVTRGTATGADWLSNLNCGMQFGPSGTPVHAGFHEVWKSFAEQVRSFFRQHRPRRIHCVGHSLGGALATLNADYCSSSALGEVVLYTFGCPRAGDAIFSRALTRRVGQERIFRVSHPADPVPMIPLFPFWHLPAGGVGIEIDRGQAGLVSVAAHGMASSYVPAMTGQTWEGMAANNAQARLREREVKSWLEQSADGHGRFLMGSAALLTMIARALGWLLGRARDLLVGALGTTLAVGCTLLDQMAWLLSRGAALSADLGRGVVTVVSATMGYLGRTAQAAGDVTVAFLRWVLGLLYNSLANVAQVAVRRVFNR